MAFHDQADQVFAIILSFAQELLGSRFDTSLVRTDLNLSDGFDVDGHTLSRVESLAGSNIKGHQLQREFLGALVERNDEVCSSSDDFRATATIDNQSLVGADLAQQAPINSEEGNNDD